MKEKEKMVCPFCGNDNVYRGEIFWINANTGWEGKRSGEFYKNECQDCDGFDDDFITLNEYRNKVIVVNEPIEVTLNSGVNIDTFEVDDLQYVTTNLKIDNEGIWFELWDVDGKLGDYFIDIKYFDKITLPSAIIALHRDQRIYEIFEE